MKPARLASSKFARWAGPMWIGCVQSTSPISSPGRTLRVSFHLGRVDKIEEDRRKQQQRQGEWRRCLEPADQLIWTFASFLAKSRARKLGAQPVTKSVLVMVLEANAVNSR